MTHRAAGPRETEAMTSPDIRALTSVSLISMQALPSDCNCQALAPRPSAAVHNQSLHASVLPVYSKYDEKVDCQLVRQINQKGGVHKISSVTEVQSLATGPVFGP